jgi:hypothetical protein
MDAESDIGWDCCRTRARAGWAWLSLSAGSRGPYNPMPRPLRLRCYLSSASRKLTPSMDGETARRQSAYGSVRLAHRLPEITLNDSNRLRKDSKVQSSQDVTRKRNIMKEHCGILAVP